MFSKYEPVLQDTILAKQHTTATNCSYKTLKVISLDRDTGKRLLHKDKKTTAILHSL